MAKRTYGQDCALARAGDLIGARWTLLLVRDLLVSPRRFNDLLGSLQGIGTNLLASRLRELESAGLIERRESDGVRHYALTRRGRALEPAVLALYRWSLSQGADDRPYDVHRDDWDLLALKSLFQPGRAADLRVSVQFEAAAFMGWAEVGNAQMRIGLGRAREADLVVAATVRDLFLGRVDAEALLTGGDPATLRRFMSAFALRA